MAGGTQLGCGSWLRSSWSWIGVGAQFSIALLLAASGRWEDRSGGAIRIGPSRGQNFGGACRSEGLLGGQHVPDGLGHAAGDVDPGDLRATLAAETTGGALVALGIDGIAGAVYGRLDQRPAQVARSVLRQAPESSTQRSPPSRGRCGRPASTTATSRCSRAATYARWWFQHSPWWSRGLVSCGVARELQESASPEPSPTLCVRRDPERGGRSPGVQPCWVRRRSCRSRPSANGVLIMEICRMAWVDLHELLASPEGCNIRWHEREPLAVRPPIREALVSVPLGVRRVVGFDGVDQLERLREVDGQLLGSPSSRVAPADLVSDRTSLSRRRQSTPERELAAPLPRAARSSFVATTVFARQIALTSSRPAWLSEKETSRLTNWRLLPRGPRTLEFGKLGSCRRRMRSSALVGNRPSSRRYRANC
jgi:hypothetical protein